MSDRPDQSSAETVVDTRTTSLTSRLAPDISERVVRGLADLFARSQAVAANVPIAMPVNGTFTGASKDPKDANAGGIHIEPGEGRDRLSWAGQQAVNIEASKKWMSAYGIAIPQHTDHLATGAKLLSNMMGDSHKFASDYRQEQVEAMATPWAPSSRGVVSGESPEAATVPGPAATSGAFAGGDGHANPPMAMPVSGGAAHASAVFPGAMQASAMGASPGRDSGNFNALTRAIESLVSELREFMRSQRGRDDGRSDESSTAENKRTASSFVPESPEQMPAMTRQRGVAGASISSSGTYRPHQEAASLSSVLSTMKMALELMG